MTGLSRIYTSSDEIVATLRDTRRRLGKIDRSMQERGANSPPEFVLPRLAASIEQGFFEVVSLCEALGLRQMARLTTKLLRESNKRSHGLLEQADDEYDHVVIALHDLYPVIDAIINIATSKDIVLESVSFEQFLDQAGYALLSGDLGPAPASEAQMQRQYRQLLRTVFPDLKEKPAISKPGKDYQPDFGIPSIKTLVELKFLDNKKKIGPFIDQLKADALGYKSTEWARIFVVIFETRRFKSVTEWQAVFDNEEFEYEVKAVVVPGFQRSGKICR